MAGRSVRIIAHRINEHRHTELYFVFDRLGRFLVNGEVSFVVRENALVIVSGSEHCVNGDRDGWGGGD